ncbi:MAG TPA: maleylpyruvate isomerase family mycothiol-dependent enzyme [Micromonosporaceae bacterium]
MATEVPTSRATELPQTPPALGATVAAGQVSAYLGLLRDLSDTDWTRPTDCTRWDVRQIATHVAGELDESARLPVALRHAWHSVRKSRRMSLVDGLNEAQVADRRELPGPAVADDIERLAGTAIRVRLRMPAWVRRLPVPGNDLPRGSDLGYLFDVIYPRDLWMHRVDTARATRRPLPPAVGDDEVVRQVVRDLDRFWRGPAVVLDLSGPGAGRWLVGTGTATATAYCDAVGLLRLLSGRPAPVDLVVSGDSEVDRYLRAARVAF